MKRRKRRSEPLKKAMVAPYTGKYHHIIGTKYTEAAIEQIADELLDWINETVEEPGERQGTVRKTQPNFWLKDFLVQKHIGQQRVSEFEEKSPYFAYVLGLVKDIQESKLVKLGMSKNVNPGVPVFALKNVAGWRDHVEWSGTVTQKQVFVVGGREIAF